MKKKKFSLNSYKYLLKIIKKNKRNIITFNEFFQNKKGIILRHDVDFCLSRALKIAKVEYNNKIISTFFVMINSKLYDLSENNNLKNIRKIISLGHEVGLHFDAGLYNSDNICLDEACNKECEKLEFLIGNKINIISFHRPKKILIGRKSKIGSRYHTYMPELIESTKYCSDSAGSWKYDDPEDLINDSTIKNIQLLTHPIWWTTPQNLSPGEKVAHHLKEYDIQIKKEAAKNCVPYKVYLHSANILK